MHRDRGDPDLERAVENLEKVALTVRRVIQTAAHLHGDRVRRSDGVVDPPNDVHRGVRPGQQEPSATSPQDLLDNHGDNTITIPTTGPMRSLNLSNAVAVVAYELIRQVMR